MRSRQNHEIGAVLFVSPNTAKTHAVSIYRKLDDSTRGQAVAHARELASWEADKAFHALTRQHHWPARRPNDVTAGTTPVGQRLPKSG